MMRSVALLLVAIVGAGAFVSKLPTESSPTATMKQQSSSSLAFGIPTFQPKESDKDGDDSQQEKKIDKSGFLQLLTAGMGSPFLGDYEGTDEETGTMKFSLEANNLVDENGNSKQTKMPYFESGWVDEDDEEFKWPWEK